MFNRAAAAPKWSSSATATKDSSWIREYINPLLE
jgi:hypothetical protein